MSMRSSLMRVVDCGQRRAVTSDATCSSYGKRGTSSSG
jgi:hypothetical protein